MSKFNGFFIIGVIFILFAIVTGTVINKSYSESQNLLTQIEVLKNTVEEKDASTADIKTTLDLATEFHFDPYIVILVRHEAKKMYKEDESAWRFIQTPDYAAYLMLSVIYVESKGDPNQIGDSGKAVGLSQIWLSTANDYEDISKADLLLPENNVRLAFVHFKRLLEKYNGNFALALYAWNRGEGTVDKLIAYSEPVENSYGAKVYNAALHRNTQLMN